LPRNTVDAMLETLRQAGLHPETIEVRPLALVRVADEKDAIVINAESDGFDIAVMINGIPELLRSLPFPAGTDSPDEKIAEVKEELERTVAFYNSSHKGGEITAGTAAFVSGELGEVLAGTLEQRVKPLPQLLSYSDGLDTREYASNIGLALRQARPDMSGTQVNLNVTPEVYLPKPFPVIQLASWAFIVLAVVILLLFGISTMRSYSTTLSLQSQVDSAQIQVDVRQGTQTAISKLQTQIDDAKSAAAKFTQPLDTAQAQREKITTDLGTITSLLPGIVNLNSINYATSITVTGTAPDDTTVNDYVRALTNSGQFSSVLITNMSEVAFNNWTFALALK
jgi:Tfp pilus assembly protein PilN